MLYGGFLLKLGGLEFRDYIGRCAEYELPEPIFEEFGDGIKVTIFRKVSNECYECYESS